jgi:glutathione S-transferase
MLAKELEIDLNLKVVNLMEQEHLTPEFLKLNPNHTVPVLEDHENNLVLTDSHSMLIYLIDKAVPEGHSLYPKDFVTRALINDTLFFDLGTVFPAIKGVIFPVVLNGEDEPSAEAVANLDRALGVLETKLEGRKYLVGEQRTIADLSMFALLYTPTIVEYDIHKFVNVSAWFENIRSELVYNDDVNDGPVNGMKEMIKARRAERAANSA